MTNSDRLREIESKYKLGPNEISPFTEELVDLKWAIARVKQLTSCVETFIIATERDELTAYQVDEAKRLIEEES